jgi:hypothetical protein
LATTKPKERTQEGREKEKERKKEEKGHSLALVTAETSETVGIYSKAGH